MNESELEIESLKDLKNIIEEAEKWGIKLVLIGGYAVRAYTKGYRFTKDIDLVTTKEALGNLKALLKSSGYSCRDTEFGVAGSKKFNEGFIDMHISVGRIFDMSTGLTYPVTDDLFLNAKKLKITGYHKASEQHACMAPVVDLETLLVLKSIPTGRIKDRIDVLALLLDKGEEINPAVLISRIPEEVDFREHLVSQLRSYADFVRRGEADKSWFNTTGSRLPSTEKRKILRFIRETVNTSKDSVQ
jgi:hypothetical protein